MKNKQQVCSDCDNTRLYLDPANGELVCENCGNVISKKNLSLEPEWRAFNQTQRDKRTRTGSPLNLNFHDKGLSTIIGWKNIDHAGRPISPEKRDRLYRLRKWNRRSKIGNSRNRNLSRALSMMQKLSYELNLPNNVLQTASIIYRKALKKNMTQGRTIISVVVASIYAASRKCGLVRSLTEIAEAANISRKTAARDYRFLHKELDLEVPRVNENSYLRRLVSRLRLRGRTEILAKKLMEKAVDNKLTNGRSPAGIAAACIYISSYINDERRTQNSIALEAQITEVTIRNRYKELLRNLDLVIQL
jgi:transcription initiation factor TFIIB